MAYSKFHPDWKDEPDTTTPITEAALEHIEQGVVDADAAAATANAKRLDQIVAPTSDVSLNSQKIIGLAEPTVATDAATKAYVDAHSSGLVVKAPVTAATTANITLSGAQTIDGVSVVATNRVLVKNQTDASENGIYVAAAGAWARSTDADVDAEVVSGMFTLVEGGTVGGGTGWVLSTPNPITVDTTDLSFTQFSSTSGPPSGAAAGVLSGTYPNPAFAADMATQAELDAHVTDPTAAHAAGAISFTPDGSIAATTVQAAIIEVRDEAGGGGGGSVNDQTIVVTDNTVNNVTTSKHGWTPKASGSRSHYFGGTGQWEALYSAFSAEFYVDAYNVPGGDGLSRRGAFTTFAAANAAAAPRSIIYILSDLNENCVLTKEDVKVQGIGRRVMYGNGSTSANNITFNVTARSCQIDNLYFVGGATFKGVHLCLNFNSGKFNISNINIDGTTTATSYPTSPGAGTGHGGIGILCHHAEEGLVTNISIANCSIGVGLGTWSTGNEFNFVSASQNAQDLVVGLYTGPYSGPAVTSSPFGYGQVGTPAADDQCGFGIFRHWRPVSNVDTGGVVPSIDLIGSGVNNYAGSSGGQHLFEKCIFSETGALGPIVIRIGSCGNTFTGCSIANPAVYHVNGQKNHFIDLSNTNAMYLSSDNNIIDNMYNMPAFSSAIVGTGSNNTFRNCTINSWGPSGWVHQMTGAGHKYEQCTFAGTSTINRTLLGSYPTVTYGEGVYEAPYGTTVPVTVAGASTNIIRVANGVGFTIPNPLDGTNATAPTAILVTTPLKIRILNSSGGAMGAITWGSKFKLAGAFVNPANGKWRTIDFFYDYLTDFWIETDRAAADI